MTAWRHGARPRLAIGLADQDTICQIKFLLTHRSARGQTWTQLRVRNFRGAHQIPVYREGERAERHELILTEAASRLGISKRWTAAGKSGLRRRPLCHPRE